MWTRLGLIVVIVLSAAAAAACSGGGRETQRAATTYAAETSADAAAAPLEEAAAAGGAAAGDSEGSAAARDESVLAGAGPKVIQTATLRLSVARGRFEEAVNRARTIVTGLGGFVTSSSASQGEGRRLVRGSIILRVPADAYGRAMSSLADLGKVEAREEAGEDVSAQFVDLRARARHLGAVEAQLLEFLDRTRTVAEALAVQNRLDDVQLELEGVRGQLRYLEDQTAYATIALDVVERGTPVSPSSDEDFGVGDAWGTAVHALATVGSGLLVALVTAGPFLLGLAGLLLGVRLVRRRGASSAPTPTP